MEQELQEKYYHTDKMKVEKRAQIDALTQRQAEYEQYLQPLTNYIQFRKIEVDSKKTQLKENDTEKALLALENKISNYEQNIFHMQSFIKQKGSETDVAPQKRTVMELIEKINQRLIENCVKSY